LTCARGLQARSRISTRSSTSFHTLQLGPIRFGTTSATLQASARERRRVSFVAVAIDRGARGDVFRIAGWGPKSRSVLLRAG